MTFTDRIWSATLKSWGGLFAVISLVASLVGFFAIPESKTVSLNYVLLFIFILFFILVVFIRTAYEAHQHTKLILPKVKTVIDAPPSYREASVLLLLEPTNILSYDSIISLYYVDSGIERLTGIGKVVNMRILANVNTHSGSW